VAGLVDEQRLRIVARQHGIKKVKDNDSITKLFVAYLRRAEESALGSVSVELTISCPRPAGILRRFSAMLPLHTRWTLTPSPSRSSRSSPRRIHQGGETTTRQSRSDQTEEDSLSK
jgi:hypothetical protein